MDIPFIYGEIASGKNFRDHTLKTNSLVQYFASLINTIIISPLSWGKSSLVNKAEFIPLRLCEAHNVGGAVKSVVCNNHQNIEHTAT